MLPAPRFARGSAPFLAVAVMLPAGALGAALATSHVLFWILAALALVAAAFTLNFFRDPDRTPSVPPHLAAVPLERLLLAPADGVVVVTRDLRPGEAMPFFGGPGKLLSIFLSALDVHVQRSPVAARVEEILYRPGRYLWAWNEKASEDNEQSIVALRGRVLPLVVKQIAGTVARRIVLWVRPGRELEPGERFGMIRFGSRVDLYAPPGVEWTVAPGARVAGGQTVVGVLHEKPKGPRRTGSRPR